MVSDAWPISRLPTPSAVEVLPVMPERGSESQFVSVPEVGVPNAPPLTTTAPLLPVLTASAVATPVPRPVMLLIAGVIVLVETAVTSPFALTVTAGAAVALPKLPTLALTVAKVAANEPVPLPVTSPVKLMVWSPVLVPDKVPVAPSAIVIPEF